MTVQYIRNPMASSARAVDYTGMLSRVLRGKQDSDFACLSDTSYLVAESKQNYDIVWHHPRPIVFIGEGCVTGKSGRDTLIDIGYGSDYINDLVRAGTRFRIVIFPVAGTPGLRPATWKNLVTCIGEAFPSEPQLAQAVERFRTQFEAIPDINAYNAWERQFVGYEIDKVKSTDPSFITTARMLELIKNGQPSILQVRSWLRHALFVYPLFKGNGMTQREDGTEGVKEYLMPNRPIYEFPTFAMFDIPVS